MGFDLFDREDPRDWGSQRRRGELESNLHPAYLLRLEEGSDRHQKVRRRVWEHLQEVRRLLDGAGEEGGSVP